MTTLLRTRLIFTTKSGLASAEGSIFSLSDKSCSWNKILRLLFVNHHQRQAPRCLSSSTICSPPRPSEKLNQRSYFSICQRQPLLRSDDVRAFGLFRLSRQSSFSSRSPSSDNKSSKKRSDDDSDKEQPTNISSTSSKTSDPPVWTWVSQVLPTRWQPYARLARLDKPIGTMLLLWPCFWSTAIAAEAGGLPNLYLLSLFSVGAFTMRGAGCTINDLWDKNLDKSVARTATRPLAAGDVSTREAVAFLALQLSVGLGVLLSLPYTWYCFQWGCLSLPLVAIYPATKRFFPYPQAVLGLTFNWGAIMGFAAVRGYVDYSIVAPLYLSGVTWTIAYDTIYAHQDKHDDAKLNLQSTALTFGKSEDRQRKILHGFAALTWFSWLLAGYQADLAFLPYFTGASAAYGHLLWQVETADFNNPHNLAERFRSNSTVGAIMFASLVVGKYFAG